MYSNINSLLIVFNIFVMLIVLLIRKTVYHSTKCVQNRSIKCIVLALIFEIMKSSKQIQRSKKQTQNHRTMTLGMQIIRLYLHMSCISLKLCTSEFFQIIFLSNPFCSRVLLFSGVRFLRNQFNLYHFAYDFL